MGHRKGVIRLGWRGGMLALSLHAAAAAAGCAQAPPRAASGDSGFPRAARPVARIVSPAWASEGERDAAGEATRVMDLLRIVPGTRVADIGAGSGYYTVRLARRLGPAATIYAEDVDPAYLATLGSRLQRAGFPSVSTVLGTSGDPRLPAASVDVAILSHMYHEIADPYAFLARLAPAIAPGGRVGIVDLDRDTDLHGTPPALLRCELEAVGYRQVGFEMLTPAEGYLAIFEAPERTPAPAAITPCHAGEAK